MVVTGYRQVLLWGFLFKFIDLFSSCLADVRHPCSHKCHAGRKLCWRSHHYHLCQPLYALSLDACLCHDNLKQVKLPSQACCSLTEICLLFSWAMSIWVLANIMTMCCCCFWKCNRNSWHRYLCNGLPKIAYYLLHTPTAGSWWSQCENHGSYSLLSMMNLQSLVVNFSLKFIYKFSRVGSANEPWIGHALGFGVELNVTHLTFQNNPSLLNQMSTPHLW
jgi:hypothetical protein